VIACSPSRRTTISSPAAALLISESPEAPANTFTSRLDVPFVEDTLDASANRAMLALTFAVLRRARSLHERLQQLVDREPLSETRTSLAARWPVRREVLLKLTARLSAVSRAYPFTQVTRSEITSAGLTAVAADPIYAQAWNRGWRAIRHGLESGETTERLWVSPSWEIYERWCYLRIGKMLSESMPAWGWHRRTNPDKWIGTHDGRRAELRLQPTFRSRDGETDHPMWSISKERVPDLVLTISSIDGTRFIVFDAKYRTSRTSVLDAMASAHIYQDSLRIGSRRPEASLIVVPCGGGAPWLEAPGFQAQHRVGVQVLSPDATGSIPSLVRDALQS
jgi:hypothetical protein